MRTQTWVFSVLFFVVLAGCSHGMFGRSASSTEMIMDVEEVSDPATGSELSVVVPVVPSLYFSRDVTSDYGEFVLERDLDDRLKLTATIHNIEDVHIDFTVKSTDDVRSPKSAITTFRYAYLNDWEVTPVRRTLKNDWARFEYEGDRQGVARGGTWLMYRMPDQPEYTMLIHGEWPQSMHDSMLRGLRELRLTAVVIPKTN